MKTIKKNKFTIRVNAPVAYLFEFLLNPVNTPKWVDGITREETDAWPVQEGTIYRNQGKDGVWNEYIVTSLEKNKSFIMKMKDGNYHVRYMFVPISESETELEYFEWVIRGVLPDPFTKETLAKLKTIVESSLQ